MYRIDIIRSASKELDGLHPAVNKRIVAAIYALAGNPRPEGCKKLKGKYEPIWRIRVGDYRVLYYIDDKIKVVGVQKVGHRKDIYR